MLGFLIALCAFALAATAAATQPLAQAGERVADVLRRLGQAHGLPILFSSRIVDNTMRVHRTTDAMTAEAVLTQVLSEQGLVCNWIGRDCVVVSIEPSEGLRVGADSAPPSAPATPPVRLPGLEVLPGSYPLVAGSGTYLDRDEITAVPHFSDDVYRMLRSLPGVAAADFSAPLHVRGGRTDELLVLLDGMELRRPYHLPNLQNPLTVLDPNLIGSIDFHSASWPARFGGRSSAVMDIESLQPEGAASRALGISGFNAFANLGWADTQQRRSLLTGVRPGYLNLALDFAEPEAAIDATYFDTYSVYRQAVGEDHQLSAHLLHAENDVRIEGEDRRDASDARTRSSALWLRWTGDYNNGWNSSVQASHEADRLRREAIEVDLDGRSGQADEARRLRSWQLKGWVRREDGRGSWEFGADARDERTRFDYRSVDARFRPFAEPTLPPLIRNIDLSSSQRRTSLWVEREQQIGQRWAARASLRHEDLQEPGQLPQLDLMPAASLGLQLSERASLGMSLGWHWQGQRSDEISVQDGQQGPFEPEIARHLALSYRYAYGPWSWRAELFDKRYQDPRSYFENLLSPYELLPENQGDRVRVEPERAFARGLELGVSKTLAEGRIYASYVFTRARERIDSAWFARSWEQPHALHIGLDHALFENWRFGLSLLARSGWAYTQPRVEGLDASGRPQLAFGPRNSARYSPYVNVSARLARLYRLQESTLEVYFEVLNLLNRDNPCCIERILVQVNADGNAELREESRQGLPLLPSLGLTWRF
ncbi:TonB-dependent receptor domain-containing protein [Aquimonas sp.]|uniref:TonB-dependent receptor domain-containing protein n=1 Tax=Aquimonas sp. TaxID=1872588 RepID=UPI0037C1A465